MILLVASAFAEPVADAAACIEPYVTAILPAQGATDVPVDVVPAITWSDDCALGGSFQLTLLLDDVLLAEERVDLDGSARGGFAQLVFTEELEADTEYSFVVATEWGESEGIFTTGSSLVVGADAPEVTDYRTYAQAGGDGFYVYGSVSAMPGEDPDELAFLVLRDANGEVVDASNDGVLFHDWLAGEQPETVCLSLSQIDGTGVEGDDQELCEAPEVAEEGCQGCSSAPFSLPILSMLGLLIAQRRRS